MSRKELVLLWLLCLAAPAGAEQPVTRLYTTEDGLARNWVQRIRRDNRGRLWFCTVEGLSVFDGERFATYTTADGLPHRIVEDILDASDGFYWVATPSGLFRFRPRAARPASFEKVPLLGSPEGVRATVLLRGNSGEVWCGASHGLWRLSANQPLRAEPVPVVVSGGSSRPAVFQVNALADDGRGSLWIGTREGLLRYRSGVGSRFREGCNTEAVRSLELSREGELWAGYAGGVSRLDLRSEPPQVTNYCFDPATNRSNVQSIHQFQDGEIWMGALGLARFRPRPADPQPFEFFDAKSVVGSQYIYDIAEDIAGNRWLALQRSGALRILRPGFSQFAESDGLESRYIHSVFEGRDGTLYAVTGDHHTLNRFDGDSFHPTNIRVPSSVTNFGSGVHAVALQDRRGDWWIATGMGLLRYTNVARVEDLSRTLPAAHYHKDNGLPGDEITRLYEDHKGDIWIGTYGIARWSRADSRIEDVTAALQRSVGHPVALQSFAEDRAGNIWMGLYPDGLVRYGNGHWQAVLDGLPAGTIASLLVDRQGRLWVGCSMSGVARIDAPEAAAPRLVFPIKKGQLRSDHISQLAEDTLGRIYVAGGRGVDRFDPATNIVTHFGADSGPPQAETHVLHRDRHGAIWFGSVNGLARYTPEPDSVGPPRQPAIHEVRVSGIPALVSDEGESQVEIAPFPAGRGVVEIGFGSVDFSVENRVRYRYRLLPVETAWGPADTGRSVRYAGLGSNAYRFEVQAVSAGGHANPVAAAVSFRVLGPFWKAWWFLVLAGATAVGFVYSIYFLRLRHALAIERVRAHLAADLHDDLGSGLAEIAILAEVAKQRGLVPGLDLVATRARELRQVMSDIVWAVDPSADNLENLISRWRNTAFALLSDDQLEFLAPKAEVSARVDLTSAQRHDLLLLFKEIVTNVARHASARRVRIQIAYASGWLKLGIFDDGCGFDPEGVHAGNGLKSIRQRAQALRGSLTIESLPGSGTSVNLRVPLSSSRMSM